jgi:hypothetical protein
VVPKLKNAGHTLDLGLREFERIVDGHSLDVQKHADGRHLAPGQATVRDEYVWVRELELRLIERERDRHGRRFTEDLLVFQGVSDSTKVD